MPWGLPAFAVFLLLSATWLPSHCAKNRCLTCILPKWGLHQGPTDPEGYLQTARLQIENNTVIVKIER